LLFLLKIENALHSPLGMKGIHCYFIIILNIPKVSYYGSKHELRLKRKRKALAQDCISLVQGLSISFRYSIKYLID